MLVEKDILYPGTYLLPDGRRVSYTPADVRNALIQGRRMLANRLAVPVIYEHDLDAGPVPLSLAATGPDWPASFARKCLGHTVGYELRNGVLWATADIPNRRDVDRWRACRFASPRIDRGVRDPLGNYYPGAVVSHLAVTPRPVQMGQQPVMLSAAGRRTETVFLSMSFREANVAEEKDGDKGKKDDVGGGEIGRIVAALATMGVNMPDSVTDAGSLAMALEVLAAAGVSANGPADGDLDDLDNGSATAPASAPVMMSAQQKKANDTIIAGYRKQLVGRVQKIIKHGLRLRLIDGPTGSALTRRATGANLSLTAAGDLARNELLIEVDTLERAIRNAARSAGGPEPEMLSTTETVPTPTLGGDDPEKQKRIAAAGAAMEARRTGKQPA